MNKTWKWILGIVMILVLVSAMFAIGYMWQTHMAGGFYGARAFDNHPMMRGDWNSPMQRGGWDHPMMAGRGFAPFGGFFLLGGLVKWVLFFGLLYGAYWLGRRNTRITLDPKPAAPVDTSAAPKAGPAEKPE